MNKIYTVIYSTSSKKKITILSIFGFKLKNLTMKTLSTYVYSFSLAAECNRGWGGRGGVNFISADGLIKLWSARSIFKELSALKRIK